MLDYVHEENHLKLSNLLVYLYIWHKILSIILTDIGTNLWKFSLCRRDGRPILPSCTYIRDESQIYHHGRIVWRNRQTHSGMEGRSDGSDSQTLCQGLYQFPVLYVLKLPLPHNQGWIVHRVFFSLTGHHWRAPVGYLWWSSRCPVDWKHEHRVRWQ